VRSRKRRASLVAGIVLLLAAEARAKEFPAWGDTGWVYASKRECCNAAIVIAQEYSAAACVDLGSVPRPMHGGVQRGSCTWESAKDADGTTLYRCYGEAAIWCR